MQAGPDRTQPNTALNDSVGPPPSQSGTIPQPPNGPGHLTDPFKSIRASRSRKPLKCAHCLEDRGRMPKWSDTS
eukprot:11162611-Alexandrium_andersonii.AAC.1